MTPACVLAGESLTAEPDGPAAAIARACAAAGATVQLAGKVGDDPPGDEILLSLTRHGIGHVALLRDAGTVTPVGAPAASTIAADETRRCWPTPERTPIGARPRPPTATPPVHGADARRSPPRTSTWPCAT